MPKGPLAQIELWNRPPGAVGAKSLKVFQATAERRRVEAIDNDEGCSFTVPLSDDLFTITERQCLVYQFEPVGGPGATGTAEFEVYRFTEMQRIHTPGGSRARLVGRGLFYDLDAAGLVYLEQGGQKFYEFTDTRTPSLWLSLYILPALARRGYDHITLGTVDPTGNETIAVTSPMNAMELMQELQRLTNCEAQVRRVGTTYLLDLVTSINGSATARSLSTGRSLPSLRVASNAIPMATMVVPRGSAGHDATARTIQRLPWIITAVDGGNLDITVAPLDGGTAELIRWDRQYSTQSGLPVGWYVVSRRTGREFQITDSFASTQKLRLGGGLGSLVVNDVFELREGLVTPTRYRVEEFATGNLRYPRRISAIATNTLTLVTLCSGDPVPTDDEHLDHRSEISQFIVATTASAAADNGNGTSRITVTSTASMLADDWGFLSSAGAEPWGAVKFWRIVTVVSGTQIDVEYKHLGFTNPPYTTLGGLTTCRVYRNRAVTPFVTDEVASTDAVTVSSVTSIAVNDIIEFYRDVVADLAGAIPCGTNLGAYGMVERKHTRDDLRSEVNLASENNPYYDTWTGGAGSLPDGYTKTGAGPITKLTTGLLGPGTINEIQMGSTATTTILSPVIPPPLATVSDLTISLRGRVKITNPGWTGDTETLFVTLYAADGTSEIAKARFIPSDSTPAHPQAALGVKLAIGTLGEYDLTGVLTHLQGAHPLYRGIKIGFQSSGINSWNTQVGGYNLLQTATPAEAGYFVRTSEGYALHTAAVVELDKYDTPEFTYDADVLDTSRLDALDAPMELMKGVPVYLEDEASTLASAPSQRVVRIEWDDDRIAQPRVTVDRMPQVLSQQIIGLASAGSGEGGSTTIIQQDSGGGGGSSGAPTTASYVVLGTDATLTNERVLTAGTNITLTDNGPGGTLVLAASGGGGGLTYAEAFRLARIARR